VGCTENLNDRFNKHNAGNSPHTAKYVPWEMIYLSGFKDKEKAIAVERYLKSCSGRAFAQKRLW